MLQNQTAIKNFSAFLKAELQDIIDEKIEKIEYELSEAREDFSRLDSRIAQIEGWVEANSYRIRKVD
ncbi:hypothetical protein [Okeania sp.]|uniref:hypothetical protein n=1 Tax=Okeania sp. TaxID=3100323 RepID=UPI002B4B5B4D|nr:hypothetical protein [Okeania sp.]MEB3341427.1 hypothetical protein [Okeania sp.]